MTTATSPDVGVSVLPPHDMDAEQAALGSVLLSPSALAEVVAVARPEDFYCRSHEEILTICIEMDGRGDPVDPITVADELHRRGLLIKFGGAPYLHTLMQAPPTAANAARYAEIVYRKATLRRVLQLSQHLNQLVAEGDGKAVEKARVAVDELTRSNLGATGLRTAAEMADAAVDRYADPNVDAPLSTGWLDIDQLHNGGLRRGTLTVIAARPGNGKSIMGVQLAVAAARAGHGALIVSLEMTEDEVSDRINAQIGSVELDALTGRTFSEDQWARMQRAYRIFHALPLTITDDPAASMATIAGYARECHRSPQGLGIVVIDYLQLVAPADTKTPRQEQVAGVSRSLKLLAKQLSVPVVALAQLNRGSEQRADKHPTMSDLRESGQIEQDADSIWLLHHDPDVASELEVLVVKNRSAKKGTAQLAWLPQFARTSNLTRFRMEDPS